MIKIQRPHLNRRKKKEQFHNHCTHLLWPFPIAEIQLFSQSFLVVFLKYTLELHSSNNSTWQYIHIWKPQDLYFYFLFLFVATVAPACVKRHVFLSSFTFSSDITEHLNMKKGREERQAKNK